MVDGWESGVNSFPNSGAGGARKARGRVPDSDQGQIPSTLSARCRRFGPPHQADSHQGLKFRAPQFADDIYEFVMENDIVTGLKERDPSGEFTFPRQSSGDGLHYA